MCVWWLGQAIIESRNVISDSIKSTHNQKISFALVSSVHRALASGLTFSETHHIQNEGQRADVSACPCCSLLQPI